jgi:hypothetical protein
LRLELVSRVRRESGDSLERDNGDDLGEQMESIVIKVQFFLYHYHICKQSHKLLVFSSAINLRNLAKKVPEPNGSGFSNPKMDRIQLG